VKTPDEHSQDPHVKALDAITLKRKAAIKLVAPSANNKPLIRLKSGELDHGIGLLEKALAADGLHYQFGGLLTFVSYDPATGQALLKPTNANGLARVLSANADCEKYDGRVKSYVLTDPPARLCAVIVDSETYRYMPTLLGISRQPHFRASGVLVTGSGYDRPSQMYGAFDSARFNIPAKPSRLVAQQALDKLQPLLEEFCFASDLDKSAALAACLTAAVRGSLPAAPMILVVAPEASSGKSFLCKVIAGFAGSTNPAALSYPATEEEASKLLLSVLLEQPASIMFDNATTDLVPYASMCSALTEPAITGRVLGVNKMVTVGTRTMVLASGNNIRVLKDLARRTLCVRLDPACERPAERSFKGDPLALVQRDRPHFISLALTIIKAFIVAGRPGLGELKPLSGYGDWTRQVRGPLCWLGLPDPAACIFTGLAEDPDREVLGRVLVAWHSVFADEPTFVRELVTAAELAVNVNLADALNEVAADRGAINRRRLGRWISKHEGRIVGGLKIERSRKTTAVESWRVVGLLVKKVISPTPHGNANDSLRIEAESDLNNQQTNKPGLSQADDFEEF
jgi:hypothetical protein